ncbi:DUF1642 domain-containing protein [Lactococcus lactis]|uniref:DUF1642 domain-containing protein n=1 Tax=Lactococcus lactis TaxID=1358 RepID=UPI002073E9E4|nr:DUF1642 domain-containing protein [Lactococcus lactis]
MDKTLKQKLEMLPIKIVQHLVGDTEYYKAVHVKTLIAQADKEFQELKSKIDWLNNLLDERNEEVLEKVRKMNEALPVVPECVGKMVEYAKKTKKSIRWFFTEDAYMFPEAMDWYAGSDKGLVDDIYAERQCSLINAFITGKYEVEKPQLFYLKNKLTRHYLYRRDKVSFGEQDYCKDRDDKPLDYCLFTQQEIDSMQTGSYEQIEVAE